MPGVPLVGHEAVQEDEDAQDGARERQEPAPPEIDHVLEMDDLPRHKSGLLAEQLAIAQEIFLVVARDLN